MSGTDLCQPFFIHRSVQLFHIQQGHIQFHPGQPGRLPGIGDHHIGLQRRQDLLDAGLGMTQIQHHIITAGIDRTKHQTDRVHALLPIDGDRGTNRKPLCQRAPDLFGAL